MDLKATLENPGAAKQKREQLKRDMWEAIKTENPDLAECIEMTIKKFGKPEQVIYEANGRVLDSAKLST